MTTRTLLVTNDFPPALGGIQSYVDELARRLDPASLVVLGPHAEDAAEHDARLPFPVVRHTGMLLPTRPVLHTARRLLAEHDCRAVWFGAAAPLGLLAAPLRRAGARRIVASTHGHEVGWSMLPGARSVLRRIGEHTDAVTFVSHYTRSRIASAFGPATGFEYLPPAVDTARFRPDPLAGKRIRLRLGLGEQRVVLCLSRLVPRKGVDTLLAALPGVLAAAPDTVLLVAGTGRDTPRLRGLADRAGLGDRVVFAGAVPQSELADWYNAADVFAMPCRTRGLGLDVEGFGMVFLEAAACGIPVVAGNSGGAPESVRTGETGFTVDGRDTGAVTRAVLRALEARGMGAAGRERVLEHWSWEQRARRLAELLEG
ncbi:glycosyltransferase family 4 protein [Sciscionella sediminilitoris]|uniref:glycosyltransferase family 4 protein n=1 Tax=Sciscionella sediminilitoris TaxID=1445613 RepID=UPI0004DF4AEF|nr:glycosyltransferase family 4 protein [Sciscionella sp. SE31]